MQRKGERQTMTGKEYCRYIRTYSELEGLQRAHTVVYCAQTVPGGVLAQLRWEQAGRVQCSTVLAPQGSFARTMQLLRYLCENSIGPEQWLEVLEDVHQPYRLLPETQQPADIHPESGCFCGIC